MCLTGALSQPNQAVGPESGVSSETTRGKPQNKSNSRRAPLEEYHICAVLPYVGPSGPLLSGCFSWRDLGASAQTIVFKQAVLSTANVMNGAPSGRNKGWRPKNSAVLLAVCAHVGALAPGRVPQGHPLVPPDVNVAPYQYPRPRQTPNSAPNPNPKNQVPNPH